MTIDIGSSEQDGIVDSGMLFRTSMQQGGMHTTPAIYQEGPVVEENRHLFPRLFRRLMAAYDGSDYIRAYQTRFIFYFSLACTVVLLVTFFYSILVQLIDPAQQALNLPMLLVELSGLVCFFIVLVLLAKGHAILAAHLLIIAGLSATWSVMFLDQGTTIGRLDSIVFVFAVLSITPLMVRRRPYLILVYTLVNIPILWLFMFSQKDGLGINASAFFDYLGDVSVTLLFTAVSCSTVFAMNRQAQNRLRQDIRKREEAAIHVGYESAAQFSREFKRYFGTSPSECRNIVPAR